MKRSVCQVKASLFSLLSSFLPLPPVSDIKHDGQSNGNLEAAVQRFHLLIRIMQGRRTAQGLTDARELESLLLQADHKAYEKESCTSLREYLMLARQAGLPLKFSGEATATIQHVWFKGRRDLVRAASFTHSVFSSTSKSTKQEDR